MPLMVMVNARCRKRNNFPGCNQSNINAASNHDNTALMYAAKNTDADVSIINMLITPGANDNHISSNSESILMKAVACSNLSAVIDLLDQPNINFSYQTHNATTALSIAKKMAAEYPNDSQYSSYKKCTTETPIFTDQ